MTRKNFCIYPPQN